MRSAARLVDELAATVTRADEHAAIAQRDAIRAALAGAAVEDEALASDFAVATAELARARARLGLVRASLAPLYADDDAPIVQIDGMLGSFVEAVEAPTAAWRTRVGELRADVDKLARAVAGMS